VLSCSILEYAGEIVKVAILKKDMKFRFLPFSLNRFIDNHAQKGNLKLILGV